MPLAQLQPHGSQTHYFTLLFSPNSASGALTSGVINFPSFAVPPGATITVHPAAYGNVNTFAAFVGQYPEQVTSAKGFTVPPGSDVIIPWAVDNLNELWAASANVASNGDGLTIIVMVPSVG